MSSYIKFYCLSVFVVILFGRSSTTVPSYINVCKRNDPKIDECIMNAIEALRPKLVNGIPELGVPAFEPWEIPDEFVLMKGNNLKAIGTDVKVRGISRFLIKSLKSVINEEEVKFNFEVLFPSMNIEANYDVDLKLLGILLKGNGPLQANNSNVDAKAMLMGKIIQKNGKPYLEYKDAKLQVQWKPDGIKFDNLFNGDKTLGPAVNNAVNQNRVAVMEALKPKIELMVAKYVMGVANNINQKFTYDELFPMS